MDVMGVLTRLAGCLSKLEKNLEKCGILAALLPSSTARRGAQQSSMHGSVVFSCRPDDSSADFRGNAATSTRRRALQCARSGENLESGAELSRLAHCL